MSTKSFSITFSGGETLTLPGGVFFLIASAAAAVTVRARLRTGKAPMDFVGVAAGLQYGPVADDLRWDYLDFTSASAQTVQVIISDDAEVRYGSVVSVSGSVSTAVLPSSAIADTADTAQGVSSQTTISTNGARRRITIGVLSTSAAANVRVSQAGGAGRGIEISAGTYVEFDTTAALIVRNNDAANIATWYAEEET